MRRADIYLSGIIIPGGNIFNTMIDILEYKLVIVCVFSDGRGYGFHRFGSDGG